MENFNDTMENSLHYFTGLALDKYKAPEIQEIVVKTRTIICQSLRQTEQTTEEELF